uniref:Transmembrane protein n=1 Tax=Romanomermis culicivorax TaxID=13658 RepID=A0A915JNE3_ROMCU
MSNRTTTDGDCCIDTCLEGRAPSPTGVVATMVGVGVTTALITFLLRSLRDGFSAIKLTIGCKEVGREQDRIEHRMKEEKNMTKQQIQNDFVVDDQLSAS